MPAIAAMFMLGALTTFVIIGFFDKLGPFLQGWRTFRYHKDWEEQLKLWEYYHAIGYLPPMKPVGTKTGRISASDPPIANVPKGITLLEGFERMNGGGVRRPDGKVLIWAGELMDALKEVNKNGSAYQ